MAYPKYKTIVLEKDKEEPKVTYLTLNRPDKNNAISIGEEEMTGDIKKAMWDINHDDDCNVVVFRAPARTSAPALTCPWSTASTAAAPASSPARESGCRPTRTSFTDSRRQYSTATRWSWSSATAGALRLAYTSSSAPISPSPLILPSSPREARGLPSAVCPPCPLSCSWGIPRKLSRQLSPAGPSAAKRLRKRAM